MDNPDQALKSKFSYAERLFSEAKYHEAIIQYKEILIDYPELVAAINNIGQAYEYLNNLEESIKFYQKSYNLLPGEKIFINNLANIFYKKKDYKNAIKKIDESLLINDTQIKIIEIKASCLIILNLGEEANLFFNKYIKKFPNNIFLNTLHGKNLINLNQHKLGLEFLKKGTGFIEFNDNKISII
jgi:tetratricopeptide (TPR) repeat protein|tara:strand:+ start:452 stop:1006 length:555 start_codon:yes stop_codon:yes gene_type:complete